MRKIFPALLWFFVCVLPFAQEQGIEAEDTIPTDVVSDTEMAEEGDSPEVDTGDRIAEAETTDGDIYAETPITIGSRITRYFQQASITGVRNNFVLSSPSIMWDGDYVGIGEEFFTIHWSFLPFTSVGAGLKFSGLFGRDFAYPQFVGITFQAGLTTTVTQRINVFAGAVMDIGFNNTLADMGFAFHSGFSAGLSIMIDRDLGVELKYTGLWMSDNRYVNALGVGWIWNFWVIP